MTGVLWFRDQRLYQFSESDELWLCRALVGEEGADAAGAGGEAVIATMVNRFAMLATRGYLRRILGMKSQAARKGWETFGAFLRDYSQPINPRWLHGGSKDPDPTQVSDAERRRARLTSMPYDDVPKDVRRLVSSILASGPGELSDWSQGVPEDLVGLVHFYSPVYYLARNRGVKRSQLTDAEVREACRKGYASDSVGLVWRQPPGVNPRGNAFYRVRATRNWQPGWVRIGGS